MKVCDIPWYIHRYLVTLRIIPRLLNWVGRVSLLGLIQKIWSNVGPHKNENAAKYLLLVLMISVWIVETVQLRNYFVLEKSVIEWHFHLSCIISLLHKSNRILVSRAISCNISTAVIVCGTRPAASYLRPNHSSADITWYRTPTRILLLN